MEKNNILKIAALTLLVILLGTSAAQAFVSNPATNIRNILLDKTLELLDKGDRGTAYWKDFFNDSSKIDPAPPGAGATDNYVIENGYVKMKNTYPIWTDPAWGRMKPIQITNNAGSPITNCVVKINVSYDSDMQSDYDDIRFKHESLPSTWLDYWIETYDLTKAVVWVEIPYLQTGTSIMYLFYGNPNATSESNFDNVFSWEYKWGDDYKITNKLNTEGAWDPDIAFGSNRFFVAWEEGTVLVVRQEIRGTMFDTNGNIAVSEFEIFSDNLPYPLQFRNENPSIDFGVSKFFVAWEHYGTGGGVTDPTTMDIKGRTVTISGGVGSVIEICNEANCQADPNVQFDSVNSRFCVVWEDARQGTNNYNIYGRLYDTNGNPVGGEKSICTAANSQCEPWVAYDPIHQKYMIVWEDGETPANGPFDIYAGLFDKDLNSLNTPVKLADGNTNIDYNYPCVEFCTSTQRFLVTWNDGDISSGDWWGNIWGAILDTSGNVVVSSFQISSGDYIRTDIVPYLDTLFFVTYNGGNKIYGKLVSSNGAVITSNVLVSVGGNADADWANAALGAGKIFVTWEDERITSSPYPDSYGNMLNLYLAGSSVSIVVGTEKELVLTAHITSIKIQPTDLAYWDKFIETSIGSGIVFDILHGDTGAILLHGIANGYDISGLTVNKIRLMATLTRSNPSTTPSIDMWGVSYYTNEPPYTPSSPNPANGATNVDIQADLSWSGGDPNGDPVTYDVYFGTSSSPPKVVSNQSGTTYDPGALNFVTTYHWKIVAWDSYGASTSGPTWSFTTRANNPPYTPSNPSPSNGATNVNLNADLSWTGGDPDGDIVTYDVYFGTTTNPPKVMSNQSSTTYDLGTLDYNTTYYWKIVAWDYYGAMKAGPLWSFTTRTNHPPNTPGNPNPANGAINVLITTDISWTGGDPDPGDIVTYDIYFGTTNPPPILVYGHTTTTYDLYTLNYNTQYYWKIVAWDSFGESTPGPVWSFTTIANSPPYTPSNPNPSNGASDVDIDAILSWTGGDPNGDPVTYDVYFGTVSLPPKVIGNQTSTTYDPPGNLAFGTTYYWKIVAWDNYGGSAVGPIWSFTTRFNNPPYTPSNPSPADGATNVNLNVVLSWSGGDPDGDTVNYDVYFGTTTPPPKIVSNQSATTYNPGTLNHGTKYYWKIVAWDNYGLSTSGPIWSFTTKINNPPNAPYNPQPANDATNVPVNTDLSWSGGDPDQGDTVTYDVYFGTESSPPIVSTGQTGTTYDTGTMSYNTTYYWKIIAHDNNGASAEGPIWHFKTIEPFNHPPNTPTLSSDEMSIPGFMIIRPDVEYTFTVITSDSDGDDVYYYIDWGDNTNTGWLGPFPTSYGQTVTHTWTQPWTVKYIKAKAKDIYGAESSWYTVVIIIINNVQVVPGSNQVVLKQQSVQVNSQPTVNIQQETNQVNSQPALNIKQQTIIPSNQ